MNPNRDLGSNLLHPKKYALQDDHANAIASVDASGSVSRRWAYEPFGKADWLDANFNAAPPEPEAWPVLFGGYRMEENTGLYKVRHRTYDPALGRWLSRDPIGERGGMNLYGFVGNNGVNRWDLLGFSEGTKEVPFLFSNYFTESCAPIVSVSPRAPSQLWKYVSRAVSSVSFIKGLLGSLYRTDTVDTTVPECYILKRNDDGSVHEKKSYRLLDWRVRFGFLEVSICGNVNEVIEWTWIPDPKDPCCE